MNNPGKLVSGPLASAPLHLFSLLVPLCSPNTHHPFGHTPLPSQSRYEPAYLVRLVPYSCCYLLQVFRTWQYLVATAPLC